MSAPHINRCVVAAADHIILFGRTETSQTLLLLLSLPCPMSSFCNCFQTATTFLYTAVLWFAGDDNGLIKTWDQRQPESAASFEAHTDFVSDMVLHEREQCLVAVSGDGTLTVNDLRTNKVYSCVIKGIAISCCVHWPETLCRLSCMDEEALQLLSAWQHICT